jgi:twitching motility protein PilT
MLRIDPHLITAVDQGASDLHLSAGSPIYIRVLGELRPVSDQILTPQDTHSMIAELLGPEQANKLARQLELDSSYTLENGERFRINAFLERKGWSLVARHFSKKIRGIEELNLPPAIKTFADAHQGLILVTGPARSGKSTTAAAILDHINATRDDHIITIEDPIEYLHPRKRCLVNQRSVGPHTDSFAAALRGALREDPDIIVVGELRDTETMTLALTAAETGHLVIGTLNTNSAVATIARVINLFPAAERSQATTSLSEALVGIVSQRLLPNAEGTALVPAFEVLVNNIAVANVVLSGEFHKLKSIIATGQKDGMVTLDAYLRDAELKGKVNKAKVAELLAEEL